jgi:hypothetical protein
MRLAIGLEGFRIFDSFVGDEVRRHSVVLPQCLSRAANSKVLAQARNNASGTQERPSQVLREPFCVGEPIQTCFQGLA